MKVSIRESFVSTCRLWYTRETQEVLFEYSCQKIKTLRAAMTFSPASTAKTKYNIIIEHGQT